ncbi:MAG: hypothetical protein HWN66_09570 [Candidatus Helarchaeota archaeon]|nr:hypothetical protein [Candidatus Helarchaeota archaeon]
MCLNCGWNGPISFTEARKIRLYKKFDCSKCGQGESKNFKLEEPIPNKLETGVFMLEEELRYVLLNTIFEQGVIVWDCRPEFGKCPDPVEFEGILFVPKIGDIPVFLNKRFWEIELKFAKLRCNWVTKAQQFGANRDDVRIEEAQSNMFLDGGGILLVMSEPPPTTVGIDRIIATKREDCEAQLDLKYRELIRQNKILYEIMIFNSKSFKELWGKILRGGRGGRKRRGGELIPYKRFPIAQVQKTFPENTFYFTLEQIMEGELAKLIIGFLRE